MAEQIRMRAIKPWRNMEFEGNVAVGQEFFAIEERARELERIQFAVRLPGEAKQEAEQQSEANTSASEPLVEFARKNIPVPAKGKRGQVSRS